MHSPVGYSFTVFLAIPTWKKWDCSFSSSLSNHCDKITHVSSQEGKANNEHSSAQGDEDTPKLVLEAGPSFNQQQGQEPTSPPSIPTRATTDPDYGTVAGSLRSTRDQASSDSDSSREDAGNSDMDTATGDCIMCLDTGEVTIWTAWKRVQASCKLNKGSLWTEAHLKRIGKSHQAMWGHNHESIQMEWDCALVEDHNSFEMHRMMVRIDQMLCIAVANDSQIYTRDSEAKAHGLSKTVVLLLKQYHAPYYGFYEMGMTRAMVGLQGLHLSDAFRHSNIFSSVGLKSFCPWCFKLGGNTETTATHLREVHYWLAITCDLCSPACLHSASWHTTQDVRPSVQKNAQNKKETRWKVAQEEVEWTRARKSFLELVWVAQMNPAGKKMPDAFHPILLMNVSWSTP